MTEIKDFRNYRNALRFAEREKIQELAKKKLSITQIANMIGRSKNCVATEIRENGGREKYNASVAHQRSLQIRELGNQKRSLANKLRGPEGYNPFTHLQERMNCLEMQIEILVDTIKEIRKKGE